LSELKDTLRSQGQVNLRNGLGGCDYANIEMLLHTITMQVEKCTWSIRFCKVGNTHGGYN
jgi:hypothetical protein